MEIEEWYNDDKVGVRLEFIKHNPEEILDLLVRYDIKYKQYKQKIDELNINCKMLIFVIVSLFVFIIIEGL